MNYIADSIDMGLSAVDQETVDGYTQTINEYMNGLLILDQLKVDGATKSIDGDTITLKLIDGQTTIKVYKTLVNKDSFTVSDRDGVKVSSSGTYYTKVNASMKITLLDNREFNVLFDVIDPELDKADYTALNAALEKAAAIKEDNVYDHTTYVALQDAVAQVEMDLPQRKQSTVDGWAKAINAAIKNIEQIDKLFLLTYGKATVEGNTVIIRKTQQAAKAIVLYKTFSNNDVIDFIDMGAFTKVSDGLRYTVKTNTFATIRLPEGRILKVVFYCTEPEQASYDRLTEIQSIIAGSAYYDVQSVEDVLAEVDWNLDVTENADEINYYTMKAEKALAGLQYLKDLIKTANAKVNIDGDTIKLTLVAGKPNLSIYNTLINGTKVTFDNIEGMKLYKDGLRYVVSNDATATITLENGKTYNLVIDTNSEVTVIDVLQASNLQEKTLSGNVITMKYNPATKKGFTAINNVTRDGKTVEVVSDSAYVQTSATGWIIRTKAAGSDIKIIVDGTEYVLNYIA